MRELMERLQGPAALQLLPNYQFSAALADYLAFKEQREAEGCASETATGVHAAGENDALDAKLASALLTFPSALVALAKVLKDQARAPVSGRTAAMSPAFECHMRAVAEHDSSEERFGSSNKQLSHLSSGYVSI